MGQNIYIKKVLSLVFFAIIFAFLGSFAINKVMAVWVDAPNTPPDYGTVAGEQEADFKPITKGVDAQYKSGIFGASTSGLDPAYGLTVGSNAPNGIKVTGNSFFENGNIRVSNGVSRPEIRLEVDTSNTNNGADYFIKTLGYGGATDVTHYIQNWGGNYIWQKGSNSGPVEIMRLNINNGNLGIGVVNPQAKLDVAGGIKSNGIRIPTQSLPNTGTAGWIKLGTWTNAGGGETLVLKYRGGRGYNNNKNQNSNTEIHLRRSWDGSCDTICVNGYFYDWGAAGSVNPQINQVKVVQLGGLNTQTFDVYIRVAVYSGFDVWDAVHDTSSNFIWVNQVSSDPGTAVNVVDINNSFGLLKSSLSVLSNGNVGINKVNPTEKLDVNGNIKASGTICDGAGNCIAGGSAVYWTAIGSDIRNAGLQFSKVGIGAVSGNPVEQLHVGGNVLIDKGKLTTGNATNNGNTSGIWLWSNTDSNHVIYSANSQVGIRPGGTTAGDAPDNILGSAGAEHRLRFRTATGQGWLFENNNNIGVIDFDSDNGDAYFAGILEADNISSKGTNNIFVGVDTGISGSRNTFVGVGAGLFSAGNNNVFTGYQVGYNTTGGNNVFSGYQAGYSNLGGIGNVFSGSQAGYSNTSGWGNVFSGNQAGYSNLGGIGNVFSGSQAGYSNINGSNNVFSGNQAGYSNLGGIGNVFSGNQAGFSNTNSVGNVFTGYQAGFSNTNSVGNVFTGYQAGFSNINGSGNVFTGYRAGYLNSVASDNIFIGYQAGYNNTGSIIEPWRGSRNIFIGSEAGYKNTTGDSSVFIGYQAGQNATGVSNLYLGAGAGRGATPNTDNTGYFNVFLGAGAGYSNTIGRWNVFVGGQTGSDNTIGSNNVFLGMQAGWNNTTGSGNVFTGYRAGQTNRGNNNIFIGRETGSYNALGSGNIFIGYRAGYYEVTSNKLYIDNSSTSNPLIYGDFSLNKVKINGSFTATQTQKAVVDTNGNWEWVNVVNNNYAVGGGNRLSPWFNTFLDPDMEVFGIRVRGFSDDGGVCFVNIPGYFNIATTWNAYITDLDIGGFFDGRAWNSGAGPLATATFIFEDMPVGRNLGPQSYGSNIARNKAAGFIKIPAGKSLRYRQWYNDGGGSAYNRCIIDVLYDNYTN